MLSGSTHLLVDMMIVLTCSQKNWLMKLSLIPTTTEPNSQLISLDFETNKLSLSYTYLILLMIKSVLF